MFIVDQLLWKLFNFCRTVMEYVVPEEIKAALPPLLIIHLFTWPPFSSYLSFSLSPLFVSHFLSLSLPPPFILENLSTILLLAHTQNKWQRGLCHALWVSHWIYISATLICIKFGESPWTRALFITIVVQAVLGITLEAVIFNYHSTSVNLIYEHRLQESSLLTAYANARSLLVYYSLFIIAQLFTLVLVIDAVNTKRLCTFSSVILIYTPLVHPNASL